MRLAVLGLLQMRQPWPGIEVKDGWKSWEVAARKLADLTGDPLFEKGCLSSSAPESRALAKMQGQWLERIGAKIEPPDLRRGERLAPAAFLGGLYQELLEMPDWMGGTTRAQRKESGSFYTSAELARPTVDRTLGPLTQGSDPESILGLRVCDPAMGAGPFLVAALHHLTDSLQEGHESEGLRRELRRQVARSCLWGVDVDPTAVDLARWAVWLEVDDPSMPLTELSANLRAGDALFGCPGNMEVDREGADRWTVSLLRKRAADRDEEISGNRFFHWRLEFPGVCAAGGFDAVVGNPPWETLQPNSKEFFGELDAEYRSLGKQDALDRQRSCFAKDPAWEKDWARLRAQSRDFARYAKTRFQHQGKGKPYTYRLFLELAHELLRDGGRLGMIVPSGLYTDLGSAPLRRLFLDQCQWEWLFCFENRASLFDIDSRYRFGPIIVKKGGRTACLSTAFLRHNPGEWQQDSPPSIPYTVEQIDRLSPRHRALLDIRSGRDLEILDKIHSNGRPFLASAGGDLHFAQGDFNMTSDSALFRDRSEQESRGFRPDIFGRWLDVPSCRQAPQSNSPDGWIPMAGGDRVRPEDVRAITLPLYQGAMIYDLHPSAAVHSRGAGHRTQWRKTDLSHTQLGPQFTIDSSSYDVLPRAARSPQLMLRALSNATNEHTVVPGVITDLPCGNSLVILRPETPDLLRTLFGAGVMSTLIYDWSMRQRMAGTNLNSFILEESVWPEASPPVARRIAVMAARLALITPRDATVWIDLRNRGWLPEGLGWRQLLTLDGSDRTRLQCTLDAIVSALFGLGTEDLTWVLRDCHHPPTDLRNREFTRRLDPKGFWRIHRNQHPDFRRTTLALEACRRLRAEIAEHDGDVTAGILAFCAGRKDHRIGASEDSWTVCEDYAHLLAPGDSPAATT